MCNRAQYNFAHIFADIPIFGSYFGSDIDIDTEGSTTADAALHEQDIFELQIVRTLASMSTAFLTAVAVILCILFRILNVNSQPLKPYVWCLDEQFLDCIYKIAPVLKEPSRNTGCNNKCFHFNQFQVNFIDKPHRISFHHVIKFIELPIQAQPHPPIISLEIEAHLVNKVNRNKNSGIKLELV